MYSHPKEVAQAALDLLSTLSAGTMTSAQIAAVELGAATLANHVWDWHRRHFQISKGDKVRWADFKAAHPEWELLNAISNGVKHAQPPYSELREVEWEDYDFWDMAGSGGTLFVASGGQTRAIRTLVTDFAARDLAN